jgi:hypothetical protein
MAEQTMSSAPTTSQHRLHELAEVCRDIARSWRERGLALRALITASYPEDQCDKEHGANQEATFLLAEVLTPIVSSIARRVARNLSEQDRRDFEDSALGIFLEPRPKSRPRICAFVPSDHPWNSWFRTILDNVRKDHLRRRKPPLQQLEVNEGSQNEVLLAFDTMDMKEALSRRFAEVDLVLLGNWEPRHRIELLCLSGLWLKVPPLLWNQWVHDYEKYRGRELMRPFPPPEFLTLEEPKERMDPLARWLFYRSDENPRDGTLPVFWLRNKGKLMELPFLGEMFPG